MTIDVDVIRFEDKAQMKVTFQTDTLGKCFLETEIRPLKEIQSKFIQLYNELIPKGACMNFNGLTLHDINSIDEEG